MSIPFSRQRRATHVGMLALSIGLCASPALAAISADEAAKLKTELTPFGAERAGNKDGTIPAWTGGLTKPAPGFVNGGRRDDPFASEKPLYSITAKNMAQYADKLTEGTKALLTKYPETYRVDVYPSHRTAAAPQWVYDNTFKNALGVKLVEGSAGPMPQNTAAGIPFPVPKSGIEVMWNHALRWRGVAFQSAFNGYSTLAGGKRILIQQGRNENLFAYYHRDEAGKFDGDFWLVKNASVGPALRAGEAIVGRNSINDDDTQAWVYLTGQRRVRKLPSPCCDTPTPFSAGITSFDEVGVFNGRLSRFDWKLVGKKEMLIPYNGNRAFQPKQDSDVVGTNHLNPDHIRWELHRVWVVDAELKAGQRHVSPKSRYYLDEDTWTAVLGERYDARGQLTRVPFSVPIVAPDVPATFQMLWGLYDLVSGSMFVTNVMNEQTMQHKVVSPQSDVTFTPDGMTADSVR